MKTCSRPSLRLRPMPPGAGGKPRRAGASLGCDHAGTVLIFEPQRLALAFLGD
jgi:hypothetical protein